MGNLCCTRRKKKYPEGNTKEDIERTIKDAEEDQVIDELHENFNIDTFNALFQKQKRKHPNQIMYPINHHGVSVSPFWDEKSAKMVPLIRLC